MTLDGALALSLMRPLRILIVIVLVLFAAAIGFVAAAWRSPIAVVVRPAATSFEQALIKRGAALAAAGDCDSCHTPPSGPAFAGGVGIPTPFGTIYSTNITPDDDTGIGHWSLSAFRRALREGIDREGRQLYPAFPYDHFTLLSDGDITALYAFFMTRIPVRASAPANKLPFPLNIRFIVAAWKLLFFHQGPYQPVATQTAAWNRGAYLVDGLSHCGACHTPRNAFGAERTEDAFGGGDAEGWTAYALNGASPAPVPWTVDALRTYLHKGWQSDHGMARGPMAPVIAGLASISQSDVDAMTTYLAGVLGQPSTERRRAAKQLVERVHRSPPDDEIGAAFANSSAQSAKSEIAGEAIYEATCASCHDGHRPLPYGGIDLALSTGPSGPDARNVINMVLWGLPPAADKRSAIMPGFAAVLTDRQLAVLVSYVRWRFSGKPAWPDLDKNIRAARAAQPPVAISPAPGTDPSVSIGPEQEARP